MCQFISIKSLVTKKQEEVKEIKHINLCKLNEQNKLTAKSDWGIQIHIRRMLEGL